MNERVRRKMGMKTRATGAGNDDVAEPACGAKSGRLDHGSDGNQRISAHEQLLLIVKKIDKK